MISATKAIDTAVKIASGEGINDIVSMRKVRVSFLMGRVNALVNLNELPPEYYWKYRKMMVYCGMEVNYYVESDV